MRGMCGRTQIGAQPENKADAELTSERSGEARWLPTRYNSYNKIITHPERQDTRHFFRLYLYAYKDKEREREGKHVQSPYYYHHLYDRVFFWIIHEISYRQAFRENVRNTISAIVTIGVGISLQEFPCKESSYEMHTDIYRCNLFFPSHRLRIRALPPPLSLSLSSIRVRWASRPRKGVSRNFAGY